MFWILFVWLKVSEDFEIRLCAVHRLVGVVDDDEALRAVDWWQIDCPGKCLDLVNWKDHCFVQYFPLDFATPKLNEVSLILLIKVYNLSFVKETGLFANVFGSQMNKALVSEDVLR